ncbi:hypothetical protein [Candidatus Protofrankia californiensis]|uniref:hypothetical protein n=1 Tax=Candidatus Protofrankia californiensis TaxID=1839754 RepID=UPI0010415420|nr:hypothetical protein [Candidatus Protofrankia californiensis]
MLQVTVDDRPRPIRRSARSGGQLFTVHTGGREPEPTEGTRISYTYRALVQQHGHVLYLDFDMPAKGVEVELAYGDCGIRHVNVLDFIAGAQPTRVSRSPKDVTPPTVGVRFDGWVFPKSGVAFAWVLEREMAALPRATSR